MYHQIFNDIFLLYRKYDTADITNIYTVSMTMAMKLDWYIVLTDMFTKPVRRFANRK